ncbi:MAG: bifunctional phosphoglucose/phosphomannose isomerase [Bacteroidota bacterium]
MKAYVEDFPNQILNALQRCDEQTEIHPKTFNCIIIAGMGGSGICGMIFNDLYKNNITCPVIPLQNYDLPAFVNHESLVILCSYSGNTEETLSVFQQAIERQSYCIAMCSGGTLAKRAKELQIPCYSMPTGQPPRASIAYPFVFICDIFTKLGLLKDTYAELKNLSIFLKSETTELKSLAFDIAKTCLHSLPILYGFGLTEGVLIRCRQQINENSKMLCWHHMFPEMNHNELVGWAEQQPHSVVLAFHTAFDVTRNIKRFEFCKPIFESRCKAVLNLHAKGHTALEQSFYLILLGDWISCYLADLKAIDPTEVKVIDGLKAFLNS